MVSTRWSLPAACSQLLRYVNLYTWLCGQRGICNNELTLMGKLEMQQLTLTYKLLKLRVSCILNWFECSGAAQATSLLCNIWFTVLSSFPKLSVTSVCVTICVSLIGGFIFLCECVPWVCRKGHLVNHHSSVTEAVWLKTGILLLVFQAFWHQRVRVHMFMSQLWFHGSVPPHWSTRILELTNCIRWKMFKDYSFHSSIKTWWVKFWHSESAFLFLWESGAAANWFLISLPIFTINCFI